MRAPGGTPAPGPQAPCQQVGAGQGEPLGARRDAGTQMPISNPDAPLVDGSEAALLPHSAPTVVQQVDTGAFKAWFGDSAVVNPDGTPRVVFHKTKTDFTTFTDEKGDGLHFGSAAQASARGVGGGARTMPVYLKAERLKRMKDQAWGWKAALKAARRSGFDGVVYLNRFEGISRERFQEAFDKGITQDQMNEMPDSRFRKLFPEASDSFIVFTSTQVKSVLANSGAFDPKDPDITR